MDEFEALALAALAARNRSQQQSPQPNPDGTYGTPPDGMILNPKTGQMTSRELLANNMDPTRLEAAGAGGMRGLSFGGADEVQGGMNALLGSGGDMGQRYEFGREYARAREDAAQRDHPLTFAGSEVAGAVGTALTPMGPGGFTSLPVRVASSAASGAAGGGAYGFLAGEGVEGRLDGAKFGAAVGGGVGAIAPAVGSAIGGVANRSAANKAIRDAVRGAPSTDQLRAVGQAAYQQVDDAGVRIRPDRTRAAMDEIAAYLKDAGAGYTGAERVIPASRSVMDAAGDVGAGANSVPFEELDMFRRYVGNAGTANPANRADARNTSEVVGRLDDFIAGLGPKDVDAGDLQTLQEVLPKARDIWTRMSKSQRLDDAVDAADNYLSGPASGLRNQFRRIVANPKLSRGFTEGEIAVMKRVAQGTIPERILYNLGSGIGQIASTAVGGAAGLGAGGIGGVAGMLAGAGVSGVASRAAEGVARRNAEIARAIVANGKLKNLPVANPQSRAIVERLVRRGGAVGPQ